MGNTPRVFRSDSARACVTARPEENSVRKSQSTFSATEISPMVNCKMVQLCALGDDALNAIRRALQGKNGGYVTLEVLTAMGIASGAESGTRRRSAFGAGVLECPMAKLSAAQVRRQFRKAGS